jgi:hypothetical protein
MAIKNRAATVSRLTLIGFALALSSLDSPQNAIAAQTPPDSDGRSGNDIAATQFVIAGLISPATVAETIFVQSPALPRDAVVTYYLDDQVISSTSIYPFWIGRGASPSGYSLHTYASGQHELRATATQPNGRRWTSNVIKLNIVTSLNSQLSNTLSPYLNQAGAQQVPLDALLQQLSTSGAMLSAEELQTRRNVMTMYLNWGIDPALDNSSDQSALLASLVPTGWAHETQAQVSRPWSMKFSPDAPFYQAIPKAWPRIALPTGYIHTVQLNASPDGDGIGFGEVTAKASDPLLPIRSQWFNLADTLHMYPFRIPIDWPGKLPGQKAGDLHMVFIDPAAHTFISTYKTSVNPSTHGPNALYAAPPASFNSLGDHGGSIAANFAELPVLLQPGESTNPDKPIAHALGGPVGRVWAARVYPATARDADVLSSKNSCTNTGYTNTGLIPYGGVIQLAPALDLTQFHLSLPAYRILQAIQTYGYYVMDFGCSDFDIYTAISQTELDPYGGLWGNRNGPGVQNEIQGVLTTSRLYVVAPLTKKQ